MTRSRGAARRGRLRRRRGASPPRAAVTESAQTGGEVPRRHDDGQDPGEGRDRDRREVRRPAVRLQEPAERRHRGLRHRHRQRGRRQARRQAEVHRGDLGQPHPVPQERDGRPDPLDDDDQRGARPGDRLLRALLRRPRPHAGAARTRTSPGVKDLGGKSVCTALGSTYEENLNKQAPRRSASSWTPTRSASS